MTAYIIVLAHIQGVPVEEFLLPWLSGAGGLMIVLATSVGGLRLIRTRRKL